MHGCFCFLEPTDTLLHVRRPILGRDLMAPILAGERDKRCHGPQGTDQVAWSVGPSKPTKATSARALRCLSWDWK